MGRLLGALVLCGLALLTSQRVAVWQSDVSLWTDAVQTAPRKPRPIVNLASALMQRQHGDDLPRAEILAAHGLGLAKARTGWEYREGVGVAGADLALIELMTGRRDAGRTHLAGLLTTELPFVRDLCARFQCQATP